MTLKDFKIGTVFHTSSGAWHCTDTGTRAIAAIKMDHEDDPSWYIGPPYELAESVFDEYDQEGCSLDPWEWKDGMDAAKAEVIEVADEDLQKKQCEATMAFRWYFPEAPSLRLPDESCCEGLFDGPGIFSRGQP